MLDARINRLRFSLLLFLILLSMGTEIPLCIAGNPGQPDTTLINDRVHTFDLKYSRSKLGLTLMCKPDRQLSFVKEPDFGKRDITRGFIPVGTDKKEHIGFAWDRDRNKLHLDLNQNKDLTDDPNNVFLSDTTGRFQIFSGIHLSLQKEMLRLSYEIRMEMYQYGKNNPSCSATIVSGFAGEMTLHGKKWDVTVVDNMSGDVGSGDYFFLAPKDVDLGSAWNWCKLNVPRRIFFGSHYYDISFEFQPGITKPTLQLTLAESETPMGQLEIDGQNIARLVLQSNSITALFHQPEQSVSIPAGNYHCCGIYLYDEKAGLFEGEQINITKSPLVSVLQDQSATLKAGGPLNNSVNIRREGNTLILSYKLTGAGEQGYKRLQDRRDKPPVFAIYKGNTQIVSDTFEYG